MKARWRGPRGELEILWQLTYNSRFWLFLTLSASHAVHEHQNRGPQMKFRKSHEARNLVGGLLYYTACAQHTRWIRAATPSVRVQHCFHSPRRREVEICLVSAMKGAIQRTTTKSVHLGSNRGKKHLAPLTLSITGSNELSIRGTVAMPRQACALA